MSKKPNCYKCIYRRSLPGDAHSQCLIPKAPKIKANAYGFNSGWFYWPVNFDPVWLESCDGYEPFSAVDKGDKNE